MSNAHEPKEQEEWALIQRARFRSRACDGCGERDPSVNVYAGYMKEMLAPHTLRLCHRCSVVVRGCLEKWHQEWRKRLQEYPLIEKQDYCSSLHATLPSFSGDLLNIVVAFLYTPFAEVDGDCEFFYPPIPCTRTSQHDNPLMELGSNNDYITRLVWCRRPPKFEFRLGIEFSNGMRLWNQAINARYLIGLQHFNAMGGDRTALINRLQQVEQMSAEKTKTDFLASFGYPGYLIGIIHWHVVGQSRECDFLQLKDAHNNFISLWIPLGCELTPSLPIA